MALFFFFLILRKTPLQWNMVLGGYTQAIEQKEYEAIDERRE